MDPIEMLKIYERIAMLEFNVSVLASSRPEIEALLRKTQTALGEARCAFLKIGEVALRGDIPTEKTALEIQSLYTDQKLREFVIK